MKFCWFLVLMLLGSVANGKTLEGFLEYEYGDNHAANVKYHQRYFLHTGNERIALSVSEAFEQRMPIRAWSGQKVAIQFKAEQFTQQASHVVQSIRLLGDASRGTNPVSGAQPWVSILCKFSDVAAEPEDQSFFQNMYANTPSGLDHYWREVSYDKINVVGSLAVDWVELPKTHTEYISDPGSGSDADLSLLFEDCTDAVDSVVDFANGANGDSFVGINMMFNDDLDCCAWGGGRFATLDGLQKVWRTTWNPPWSFANQGVIAHEMGHGFGLPHANNSDGDGSPYDSPWDVMSSATGYGVNDAVYGRLGKHINMEFKHNLGWVDDGDGYIADSQSDDMFLLRYTAHQADVGMRFVRIPVSDGTHFVVETRKQVGSYESNLPGNAVIVHHVNRCRSEPPWVVDADVPAANYSDTEGVMWKTGETFIDPIDDYEVAVFAESTNGFNVRIRASEDLIRRQGFEPTCF